MKTCVTLTLLAAAALAAGPARAQGSVTVSGVADAGVRSVSNEGQGSMQSLISGGNATSRLTIRGTEDLGGGLSAGFHLEHGIALDTGAAASSSAFWDRRATASLASKALGEVRLGRDYVPSYLNWNRYDPFGAVGAASANNLISAGPNGPIRNSFGSGPNTTQRANNSLQWLLPAGWGGFEGGLMAAAGEGGLAADGQDKLLGARLGWAGGPVVVSAAVTTTENDLTTAGKLTDTAVAGSYDFGVLKLSAAWRQFDQAGAEQDHWLIGAVLPLGSGELRASWQRLDLSGSAGGVAIDGNGAQQFGLGYVHNLSRRTALYTTVARIANDGAAAITVPGGPSGMAGGGSSTGFDAGLRHIF